MDKIECPLCLTSVELTKLRRHKKQVHIDGEGDKIKCEQCDKSYFPKRLKEHVRSVRMPANLNCDSCEKSFPTKSRLVSHKTQRHQPKDYNFSCTICGKRSLKENQLNVHMLIHTNEYPFKCSECDSAFKQKITLVRHKKTHTGEKIPCDHCPKSFSRTAVLKKHIIRNHAQVEPQ